MTIGKFRAAFAELSREDKINLFNEYASGYAEDDEIFTFDEVFFNAAFPNAPMEAARAVHFGQVNWDDNYIRFNRRGNLESLSDWMAEAEAEECVDAIFDHKELWSAYIDDEEEGEDKA